MADKKKADPGKARAKAVELQEDRLDEVSGGKQAGNFKYQDITLKRGSGN